MSEKCKITGELSCKCGFERPFLVEDEMDFNLTLTKLFTDHAVYTVFVLRGIIDDAKDVDVNTARVLENQVEIGENLAPYIGAERGKVLSDVLTEHIKLAAATVKAAKSANQVEIVMAKTNLFANSDEVASTLSEATNGALPLDTAKQMWRLHNELVIKMATLRIGGKYKLEQETYDVYFNEVMAMVKAIYATLPSK